MNKQILLPKLSVMGIKKNGMTYFPYIFASMLCVFIFFVFSSIIHNDMMKNLPHSPYVIALMIVGEVLLGIILIPFLFYINSFLIRRRKKELGLYSILGLEKKHIGIMMLWETIILLIIAIIGGVILGIVFSKLLFLLLLNLTKMPVETQFSFSLKAFQETFFYFVFAYGLNLVVNLFEVFRSNPNDLIKGAKKGEKEPRFLWFTALLGIIALAAGYFIAGITKFDSNIFLYFFLAVALVVFGTHQFFTAGVIALLKILKGNKKFYYQKPNYVTISGMLHRMKKSASSLANICVFSTMVIITLLCTLSLWSGTEGILHHQYPYDETLNFNRPYFDQFKALDETLEKLSQGNKVDIEDKIAFTYQKLHAGKSGKEFVKVNDTFNSADRYDLKLITLSDYNQMQQVKEELAGDEVIIFSTGPDFGYDSIVLENKTFKIKRELDKIVFTEKAVNDVSGQDFYLIVKDEAVLDEMQKVFGSFAENDRIYTVRFQINGEDQNRKAFIDEISEWGKTQKGFNNMRNGISEREDTVTMNGGLLFLGIFFGIVFSMCMVLIMYYKQMTEGFDDRENFSIMQKVGMSDKEVRGTIKRQILIVFFLPLVIAVAHTIAAFGMVSKLLGAVYLFDTRLIAVCGVIVVGMFVCLYGGSYLLTSKSYYRIVKQMN